MIGANLAKMAGGGVLGNLAVAGAAAAVAVVGIGVASIKAAADFQQSMGLLITSAGESQTKISMVSAGILKMSVDTATSAKQLAAGMYYVESSGYHAADALKVLGVAAMGAKTENADLDTVAKALTAVMINYNMPVKDAASAMNGLIAAVQNGKTNLKEMAASMGQVLPVAASLHIPFAQVAGALDTMTNKSTTARQAAQNLAHVLLALSAPSGVAVKSMKEVGLSAQQVKDTLAHQGIVEALQLIEDHVGKKFPKDSVEYVTAVKNITGGIVGFKLAAQLTGPALQMTRDNIAKIAAAMRDGSGAVMGWDTVQQNLNFQLDRAKEAFNVLLIVIGEKLLPIVTPLVKGFVDFMGALISVAMGTNNINTAFGQFAPTVHQVVGVFILLWNIILNVGRVLGSIFGPAIAAAKNVLSQFASSGLGNVLDKINQFLVDVNNAVQAFADWFIKTKQAERAFAALGAALASVINFFTRTEIGAAILKGIVAGLAAAALAFALSTVPALVAGFLTWASAAGAAALATIAAAAPFVLIGLAVAALVAGFVLAYNHFSQFRQAVASTGAAALNLWNGLKQLWSMLVTFLAPIFALIGNDIKKELIPVFQQVVKDIQGSLLPAWKSMQPALAEIWKALQTLAPVLKIVGALILAAFVMALVILASTLVGVVKGLAGLISGLAIVLSGIMDFFSGTMKVVSGALNFLHDLFTGNFKKLGSDLGEIWSGISLQFKGIWEIISGIFLTALNGIAGFFSGFMDTIIKIWTDLANQLVGHSIIPDMVNAIIAWFTKVPTFIISVMTKVANDIKATWTAIYTTVTTFVVNIYNAIVTEFTKVKTAITAAWVAIGVIFTNAWNNYIVRPLTDLAAKFTAWAQTQITNAGTWGTNMMKGFGQAITIGMSFVTNPIGTVATNIANILGFHSPPPVGPLAQSNTWMPNMMAMFGQGISANTTKVTVPVNTMASQVANSMQNMSNNVNNQSRLINLNLSTIGTTAQQTNQKTTQQMQQMQQSVQNSASGIKQSTNTINTSIQGVNTQVQSINQIAPAAFQNVGTSSKAMAQTVDQSGMQVVKSTMGMQQGVQQASKSVVGDFGNVDQASMAAAQNSKDASRVFETTNTVAKSSAQDVQKAGMIFIDAAGNAKDAAKNFDSADKDIAKSVNDMAKVIDDILKGHILQAVEDFAKAMQEKLKACVEEAKAAAQNIAALLGHSKPTMGPLMDDDKWGEHFVQNIVGGMHAGMPELNKATNAIAGSIASGLGGSLSGGSIALKLPASSSLQNNQNMTIVMQMDGKTVGKVATKYMEREFRVQGNIRNG
jgi:TP901 family phage tail tape measure protein